MRNKGLYLCLIAFQCNGMNIAELSDNTSPILFKYESTKSNPIKEIKSLESLINYKVETILTLGNIKNTYIEELAKVGNFMAVGCDIKNELWLAKNKEKLKSANVIPYVIACDSKNSISKLESVYGGVFIPTNLDIMKSRFGIGNYPFAVINGWVMQ